MTSKLSVLVTQCEHGEHIRQAVDSVRMQRADFEIEVLVDDSAGGESSGSRIRRLLDRATGEYVARLDTCDFWLREDKLRAQVAALEARPELSLSAHAIVLFHESGSEPGGELAREPVADLGGVLSTHNALDPSSVVIRRRPPDAYPDWVWDLAAADNALHVLEGLAGVAYLDLRCGASRVRPGSQSGDGRIGRLGTRLALLERIRPLVASRHLDQLEYASSNLRTLIAVEQVVPPDAPVLVLSSGDGELVELGARVARHFPGDTDGYEGGLPAGGDEALELFRRASPADDDYVVVPAAARWWLGRYPELAEHLDAGYERVDVPPDAVIYRCAADVS